MDNSERYIIENKKDETADNTNNKYNAYYANEDAIRFTKIPAIKIAVTSKLTKL
jgi:hypothetical protein